MSKNTLLLTILLSLGIVSAVFYLNKIEKYQEQTKIPVSGSSTADNSHSSKGTHLSSSKENQDIPVNIANDQSIDGQKNRQLFTASARTEKGLIKTEDTLITKDGKQYPLRVYRTMLTPNDPSYNQWWIDDNEMESVWDIPAGIYETKVAVIDTGFSLGHQEFSNRWAINQAESGVTASENPSDLNCTDQAVALNRNCNNIDDNFDGIVDNETGATTRENPSDLNCTDQSIALDKSCNNIDDDDNGYIDDYRGWDFSNFDSRPQAGEVSPNGSGTTHGTAVTGILAATGNNGVGIAGVNWHTKILPIQALDDFGYGDTYTVSESIYYAADQGADIISISLGTDSNDSYLRQAMLYALDKGSIIVAAAGNDGCDCMSYPANYPEVVAVGAIGTNGEPAGFSSYGANLDILAPGQSISTTAYSSINPTSAYSTNNGTSFSTPFVSGLLALGKMSQPNAEWEEIIGGMFENADRRTLTSAAPRSNTLGYGVVHSNDMLARLRSPFASTHRYQFNGGQVIGSSRIYQCEGSTLPALPYYELKKSNSYRYTSNLYELSKFVQSGWSQRKIFSVCIGLPTDDIDILRLINVPRETLNINTKTIN